MNSTFERLDPEKRARILNAAIDEFSRKSYADASTNRIVEKAAIGKGMLFHYFGSKRELYLSLYRYARSRMDQEVCGRLDWGEGLPRVLKQLARRMMETCRRHPGITEFIARCHGETDPAVAGEIRRLREERGLQVREDVLGRVLDLGKLKPPFQNGEAVRLIRWALEGCFGELREAYRGEGLDDPAVAALMERYDRYLDLLYEAFYQEEGREQR